MKDANDYYNTVFRLFELLKEANKADSDDSKDWQRPFDTSSGLYYGHLQSAIIEIAGQAVVDRWSETGEIDVSLFDRFSW